MLFRKITRRCTGFSVAGLVIVLLSSRVLGAEKNKDALETISVTRVEVERVEAEKGVVGRDFYCFSRPFFATQN